MFLRAARCCLEDAIACYENSSSEYRATTQRQTWEIYTRVPMPTVDKPKEVLQY